MQTDRDSFILSEKNEAVINVFCKIACENGSAISLKEILNLTSLNATETELERAWQASRLSEQYHLESGMVLEKAGSRPVSELHADRGNRMLRAESNVIFARKFERMFKGNNPVVFSVSGSTSYQSVSREDDLDFFCITKKNTMWIALSKALLLARAFQLVNTDSPWICLSYIMDESYAVSEFSSPKDGLFARDALSTIVLRGSSFYEDLLRKCQWMGTYFPKIYEYRTMKGSNDELTLKLKHDASSLEKIANSFLCLIVGSYIRVKSSLLNRKFASKKQPSRRFLLLMGKDHCIYESLSYLHLREVYSQIESNPVPDS